MRPASIQQIAPPEAGPSVARLHLDVSERGDGGVRVRSDDVPGLLATGRDVGTLWLQLPDMIRGLLKANRNLVIGLLDLGPAPHVGAGETRQLVVSIRPEPA